MCSADFIGFSDFFCRFCRFFSRFLPPFRVNVRSLGGGKFSGVAVFGFVRIVLEAKSYIFVRKTFLNFLTGTFSRRGKDIFDAENFYFGGKASDLKM